MRLEVFVARLVALHDKPDDVVGVEFEHIEVQGLMWPNHRQVELAAFQSFFFDVSLRPSDVTINDLVDVDVFDTVEEFE